MDDDCCATYDQGNDRCDPHDHCHHHHSPAASGDDADRTWWPGLKDNDLESARMPIWPSSARESKRRPPASAAAPLIKPEAEADDSSKKHTERVRLLVPLLILLVCFVLHAQCGSIKDTGNRKISLPYGLCGPPKQLPKCKNSYCWCCFPDPNYNCYRTPEICDKECRKHSSLKIIAAAPSSSFLPSN
ncbi:hypothetical protein ZWY2020_000379 [Hordeum vulgare]|nr:hypothetical protein ZWY2020_000379 [Hordeum vulgare]